MELTKPQRKKVRILLDLGLQRMYEQALKDTFEICEKFNEKPDNPHDSYMKMYKTVTEYDKNIGRRFDGLSGSHYFNALLGLLTDEILTYDDLKDLDSEFRERTWATVQFLKDR